MICISEKFITDTLATINKYRMLKASERVLVGFSGGPDSMALLCALQALQNRLKITICAVHINHQLRKKDAVRDEKFCLAVCKKMKIPIKTRRVDVRQYAQKHKLSIEESARSLRYQELLKIAEEKKCSKIALGHTANDNCETVVFNLCRGTGLTGLAGIPPVRTNIIRPLIETNREQIIRYLKANRIKYCHDLSNMELGYRRNYIRHKIVPLLLTINPSLVKTITRTSEIIRDTNQNIAVMVDQALKDCMCRPTRNKKSSTSQSPISQSSNLRILESANCRWIDTRKLLSYNLLIRREIIKKMIPRLDFDAINRVLALAQKPSGKSVELNRDYLAWKEYNRIAIEKKVSITSLADQVWTISVNKQFKIPAFNLTLSVRERVNNRVINYRQINDKKRALFDKNALAFPLSVRTRKTADRFTPYLGKDMKLKDVLINDKIPVRLRDRLPLLCDQHNILWVIGSRRSNFGLINNETRKIIEIKVIK